MEHKTFNDVKAMIESGKTRFKMNIQVIYHFEELYLEKIGWSFAYIGNEVIFYKL